MLDGDLEVSGGTLQFGDAAEGMNVNTLLDTQPSVVDFEAADRRA
jgi:hypothetical protein